MFIVQASLYKIYFIFVPRIVYDYYFSIYKNIGNVFVLSNAKRIHNYGDSQRDSEESESASRAFENITMK